MKKVELFCFWSPKHPSTEALKEELDNIASIYGGNDHFFMINIDEENNKEIAIKFNITSLPNVIVCIEGKKYAELRGHITPQKCAKLFIEAFKVANPI